MRSVLGPSCRCRQYRRRERRNWSRTSPRPSPSRRAQAGIAARAGIAGDKPDNIAHRAAALDRQHAVGGNADSEIIRGCAGCADHGRMGRDRIDGHIVCAGRNRVAGPVAGNQSVDVLPVQLWSARPRSVIRTSRGGRSSWSFGRLRSGIHPGRACSSAVPSHGLLAQ